jgi:hypothetical protein
MPYALHNFDRGVLRICEGNPARGKQLAFGAHAAHGQSFTDSSA